MIFLKLLKKGPPRTLSLSFPLGRIGNPVPVLSKGNAKGRAEHNAKEIAKSLLKARLKVMLKARLRASLQHAETIFLNV